MSTTPHHPHYPIIEAAILKLNQQPDLRLEQLSAYLGYSPFYLQRLFKQWAGLSPQQFVQLLRKNHALQLLEQGLPCLQTSAYVGYDNPSSLHRLVIRLEGMSPQEIRNKGQGLVIQTASFLCALGTAFIAQTQRGICSLEFETSTLSEVEWLHQLKHLYAHAQFVHHDEHAQHLGKTLFQYWSNSQRTDETLTLTTPTYLPSQSAPTISVHVPATTFQLKVWEALLHIPFGNLASYSQIAHAIGKPQASRATGTAIASNPVGLLIPCHRVITSAGQFGHYRWSPARKQALHLLEQGLQSA